ncbi:histidine kinase N-terminal 7TM domain-containing protein [Halosimplex amylolyticum]|uniref:histidine kinase N-terminal 7TM domain-containing protein n=1 Tax=Halosimplex amylolyticum TaxID=3396616 RepID=UPI003F57D686
MSPAGGAWNVTPYGAVLTASGLLTLAFTYAVWRLRPKSGATVLAAETTAMAGWAFGQALLVSAASTTGGLVGLHVTLLSQSAIGPLWMVFALQYTGRTDLLRRGTVALLALEPLAFVAVLATTDAHGLVYADPTVARRLGASAFAYESGPLLPVHYVAQYALLLGANAVLAKKFLASRNVYRKRTFVLVAMSLTFVAAHAASVAGLSPLPYSSLGPLAGLAVFGVALLLVRSDWLLGRIPIDRALERLGSQYQSLSPVARDAALEELDTGFFVTDHEGRIVDINPAGRAVLDATDDRVVGRHAAGVIPDQTLAGMDVPLLDTDVTGEFRGVWVPTDDGRRRCFDVWITPVRTDDAALAGRVFLVHDVTDRERQKRELEAHATKLERQNERLEEFASVVSHDLRNPLNVAMGRLELVDAGDDQEHVAAAVESLVRMEAIIEDMLKVASLGQTVSDGAWVDLGTVAQRAWGTVETGDASLAVEVDRRVRGDEKRLRQLFENLFRNAVEHSSTSHADADASADAVEHSSTSPDSQTQRDADGTSSVKPSVADAPEDAVEHSAPSSDSRAPGDSVERDARGGRDEGAAGEGLTVTVGALDDGFFVEDDGPGIPAEIRGDIFESGFTTRESGTGLGLSIVKTIADAHGWTSAVTESPEGGARFEFTETGGAPVVGAAASQP